MNTVYTVLDKLANDNSRLAKEAILRSELQNQDFWQAARLALDPFVNFYIKKIPAHTKSRTGTLSLAQALTELGRLSNREVTGNAGIDHLVYILENVSEADSLVIERVIAKDLKCGVSEATINKIRPGHIPTYPVMLASAYDQRLIDRFDWPGICQLKLDGMRFNAIVRGENVEFRSRNGKEISIPNDLFPKAFVALAKEYGADYVFDGELLVVDAAGRPLDRKTGNGILNKAVKGTVSKSEAAQIRATIWDAIPVENFVQGIYSVAYESRFTRLVGAHKQFSESSRQLSHLISPVFTEYVNNDYEARRMFERFLAEGQEGTILKDRNAIWEDKRSKGSIKFKGELEADMRIIGWELGTGKNANRLGALVVSSEDGRIVVNVGTGFTDADRDSIQPSVVGKIASIKYNARIQDKKGNTESLFLPVFVEIREDKDVADHSTVMK
jgi:hypothetical protein